MVQLLRSSVALKRKRCVRISCQHQQHCQLLAVNSQWVMIAVGRSCWQWMNQWLFQLPCINLWKALVGDFRCCTSMYHHHSVIVFSTASQSTFVFCCLRYITIVLLSFIRCFIHPVLSVQCWPRFSVSDFVLIDWLIITIVMLFKTAFRDQDCFIHPVLSVQCWPRFSVSDFVLIDWLIDYHHCYALQDCLQRPGFLYVFCCLQYITIVLLSFIRYFVHPVLSVQCWPRFSVSDFVLIDWLIDYHHRCQFVIIINRHLEVIHCCNENIALTHSSLAVLSAWTLNDNIVVNYCYLLLI